MDYLSQLVRKLRKALSSQSSRDVERKKTGRRLYNIIDESIPTNDLKDLAESMHEEPPRLAVPIFHNGRWEYNLKKICDPEKSYREAITPKWYEKVLEFFYK